MNLILALFHQIAVDNILPVVACINDITQTAGPNTGGAVVSWIEPIATDNSGSVSLIARNRAPGQFFVVGSTEVTYRFADNSGNAASCTFSVIVVEG